MSICIKYFGGIVTYGARGLASFGSPVGLKLSRSEPTRLLFLMTKEFECPVCEQRFAISSKKKKVECPGCSRKFKVREKTKKSKDFKPAPIPLASSVPAPSALPLPKPTVSSVNSQVENAPTAVENSGLEPNKTSKSILAAAKRKRRKKEKIRGIAIIVGLALIIGTLAGILAIQLRKQTATAKSASAVEPSPDSPQAVGSAEVAKAQQSNIATTPEPTKSQKQLRHKELAPRKFDFHEAKQVSRCWNLIHPHLVKLTVHDGLGSHQAVGTIIDSRGWILTSYSTIKGASKIQVESGHKIIDQFYQPPRLSDTVRGIIATDPQQDIAVLSVNRRFIESFASVAVTEKDYIVKGEFMMQCAPPTPENAYGCYESKVAETSDQKMKLTSTEPFWVVCPDKQKALPGSPLVRIDGTLEAIHVFSENNKAHYAWVHLLKPMLDKAVDKPRPLSALQGSVAQDTGSKFGLAVDHPFRETSVQLNRLSDVCQQFDWICGDKDQYKQLQEFSVHFALAIKLVKENQKSNPELIEELQRQIKQIKDSISIAINKSDKASMGRMNKLAAPNLDQPNQFVPFFGRVEDLELTANNDILELVGIAPPVTVGLIPDGKRDPLSRDSIIMAFVQIPETPSFKSFKIRGLTIASPIVNLITRVDVSR